MTGPQSFLLQQNRPRVLPRRARLLCRRRAHGDRRLAALGLAHSIARLELGFDHLGDGGSVWVSLVANDDPARLGKGEEARGFPACTATVEYAGDGYRAFFGWIQLVRSTDQASPDAFEMDPLRFFEDSVAPFCFYGHKPVLFDAPSRDNREPMDWTAHAFLAYVPRDQGEAREVRPLVGFSWGFRIDEGGQISLKDVERLDERAWNSHVPLLAATYPSWRFPVSDSFH
jgi:hypothetical protein